MTSWPRLRARPNSASLPPRRCSSCSWSACGCQASRCRDARFEVYEAVVTQLLKDHPAARAAAARVAAEDGGLPADDVRQVLAHLAFQWQERGEFTPVPDSTIRADLVTALKDPGHLAMDAPSAARMARTLTEIAEGQLGVLVRYGHHDLGFLHRVFLEELAAEHAADQLPADDRRDLFARRACDPRWSQVLLGILWRTRRPAENSALLEVIADQAGGSRPGSLTARELLAEAVFSGFRLPAADTARHALAVLDAIEAHPHVRHRQRLLTASVAGLSNPASRFLRERLPRWTLAPHPLPPALFQHLGRAVSDTELGEPLWPVLVAALAMEDPACASSAAFALADRYGTTGSSQARDGVLRALRNAATASHAAIALACLALGWPSDPATQEMIAWGRPAADSAGPRHRARRGARRAPPCPHNAGRTGMPPARSTAGVRGRADLARQPAPLPRRAGQHVAPAERPCPGHRPSR